MEKLREWQIGFSKKHTTDHTDHTDKKIRAIRVIRGSSSSGLAFGFHGSIIAASLEVVTIIMERVADGTASGSTSARRCRTCRKTSP
jgi:hypothetical protein